MARRRRRRRRHPLRAGTNIAANAGGSRAAIRPPPRGAHAHAGMRESTAAAPRTGARSRLR
ncbi:hypothetical protein AQ766_24705 [Burkholderia pseudomallei]|nr:hypothetical protein AQ735_25180 [Burkholderia pseudomallei]OMT86047.1 hypothetical protein AQ766_24705 [Burkholderia pseudomallei]OMU03259.1 hypothetical protein AQ767_12650 [Burkholderia pseudomallei]ONE63668.1 hypothetical protein AQ955_24390 [Burkholderia pseudomallei]